MKIENELECEFCNTSLTFTDYIEVPEDETNIGETFLCKECFKHSLNLEWSIEDESYIATIQEFPGLSAFGETPQEAVKEAITAVKGFLQIIKEDGDEIPEPIIKKGVIKNGSKKYRQ